MLAKECVFECPNNSSVNFLFLEARYSNGFARRMLKEA